MIVKIIGLLIDRYQQESLDRSTGHKNTSLKVVVYQKESHQAVTITVSPETYAKLKELETCTIDCKMTSFTGKSGQAITFLKEMSIAS